MFVFCLILPLGLLVQLRFNVNSVCNFHSESQTYRCIFMTCIYTLITFLQVECKKGTMKLFCMDRILFSIMVEHA